MKRLFDITLIIMVFGLFLSGCQLTAPIEKESRVSNYYLWIKSLDTRELLEQIKLQETNETEQYDEAKINLILLYALPSSPIYNPYTAKSRLNKYSPPATVAAQISTDDFAFISLLKDQLNQQIITANKLLLVKQTNQEIRVQNEEKVAEQEILIEKLEQQITQLKNIERDINND